MIQKPKFRVRYTIYKIKSGGRGKIKSEKICGFPRFYENMDFLYKKYNLKEDDKIVVRITKKRGEFRLPFSSRQVIFNGKVKEFVKNAEEKALEKKN